jgi:phosphoribosyl 1,2-cyclic phosphate phosphodiesterase
MIACECATCRSTDPRDRRLRPSIFIDIPDRARILVDTATDLREQALTHRLSRVDAVLFTHGHADHILGLDDLRRFNVVQGGPIPCHADRMTWETIHRTFHYVFDGKPKHGGGVPELEQHLIDGPFAVGGARVTPVPLWHGKLPILGFRFGEFAYLTDCNAVPDESWPLVAGVSTVVLDALRTKPHPTHFTVDQAVDIIGRLGARRAYLTHMCHDLGHAETNARLPAGIELAYDGLVLDVSVDVD